MPGRVMPRYPVKMERPAPAMPKRKGDVRKDTARQGTR